MTFIQFPHPSTATEDGVVAVGGSLTLSTLVSAYRQGIFPWPHEDYPMLWFCPWERGILDFNELHLSRSLKKFLSKTGWRCTENKAFQEVIKKCAEVPRPGQSGTWISDEMVEAYKLLHQHGYAHSVEVWEGENLVGGIYGVFIQNCFSAESMFHSQSNASKLAFLHLVESLKSKGLEWMDVQMVTPITQSFGAKLIPQEAYLERLVLAQSCAPILWPPSGT